MPPRPSPRRWPPDGRPGAPATGRRPSLVKERARMLQSTPIPGRALRLLEVERYLAVLMRNAPAGALLDIRWRRAGCEAMAEEFRPLAAVDAERLLTLSDSADVYVGAAPRARPAGGREAVSPSRLIWADCDSAEAAASLSRIAQPTMLVASGSTAHRHAYWALTRALDAVQVELANRRIAAALGADTGAVTGAAAILRPAGTVNHKHARVAPVRLVEIAPRCYDPAGLLAELPPLPEALRPREARPPRAPVADPLLAVSPRRYVEALTGAPVPRSGKIRCPLHADGAPSLHVWSDPARGWFCFGCHRGGSIYDLAAALWSTGQPANGPLRGKRFLEVRERLLTLFAVQGRSR